MSESLSDLINQQNEEINPNPTNQQSRNQKIYKTQQNNCNIAWCKFCHHNPRILSTEEKIQISKKMEHKFKRFKICKNHNCLYCIKKTQDLNKKIEEHNLKVKKEREQDKMRNEEINSQLNMDLEEHQNANINIENKYLKEPNIEDFTKNKIKEDNNNLLRTILIGLNLEENYCLQLRSVLVNLTK